MLKLVRQQHNSGCVPACLAILAGIPYQKALKVVYRWKKIPRWNHHGTKHKDMLRALKRLGFQYKEKGPVELSKIRPDAIVIVEHPVYGPPDARSHAVVWDYERQRILDPYVGVSSALKRHLWRQTYEDCTVVIVEVR